MDLTRIDRFAATHHGLITRPAAHKLGVSAPAWYRALDSNLLEPMYPGVARVIGSARTFEQAALAAVWAVGPTAMASHRTSARIYGVERPDDDPIDVIIPDRRRRTMPAPVIVHRPRVLTDLKPLVRHGIPVTNPMRMLLDLAAVDEAGAYDALIHVLSSKLASPSAIRGALARHSIRGRAGKTALQRALHEWLHEELPPDSVLEERFAWLSSKFDLPPVDFHAIVLGYEVDFLVRGTSVIIECDGWGTHGLDRDQFEFDRIRDAELTGAGYHIVHTTWRQLKKEPQKAALRILNVLQRWAPHLVA